MKSLVFVYIHVITIQMMIQSIFIAFIPSESTSSIVTTIHPACFETLYKHNHICIFLPSLNISGRFSMLLCMSVIVFIAEYYLIMLMDSPVDGHLDCFQFAAILNKAARNRFTCVFWWLQGKCQGAGWVVRQPVYSFSKHYPTVFLNGPSNFVYSF